MFSYSKVVDGELRKQINGALATIMMGVIVVLLPFFVGQAGEKVQIIFPLMGLAVVLLGGVRMGLLTKVRNNIQKCRLEIKDGMICGYTSENMESQDSVNYFEISLCDIRNVRTLYPDITRKEYATLQIDHKSGSVRIAIESESRAANAIHNAIDGGNTEEQTKTAQGTPYRCGNCGKVGPYQGDCPDCGSSIKDYSLLQ
ncbi:MAG: hypothetical protein IJP02_03405 [Oscillospiraceae bacterium]|nr:hypothetical protein [Oscillospiraceae bacterium]